jgi:demethylmenaquinone methyltransferase/2-methoxy-6-polyprenyl-1,4-benzoquinol methylase
MSSLAFMRWLESAPGRYDAGMRAITFGRVTRLHKAVAEAAATRGVRRVLEIGCGTGSVTQRLLDQSIEVTAVEESPEMIELARERIGPRAVGQVRFCEQTASEIDRFCGEPFDAVVASLVFSDMSPSERSYVLRQAKRLLKAHAFLIIADETIPSGFFQRALFRLLRLPQAALAWVIAGNVSRPLDDLCGEIEAAGFKVVEQRRWLMGTLQLVVGENLT